MNLTTLFEFLILGIIADASLVALVLLVNAAFPNLITRARANVERMPVRSFIVGFINFLFFGLIAAALTSAAPDALKMLGITLATVLLGFLALGIAALARLIGERIDAQHDAIRQLIVGVVVIAVAALVPFVGWFLVPLVGLMSGFGAVIVAMIWRK